MRILRRVISPIGCFLVQVLELSQHRIEHRIVWRLLAIAARSTRGGAARLAASSARMFFQDYPPLSQLGVPGISLIGRLAFQQPRSSANSAARRRSESSSASKLRRSLSASANSVCCSCWLAQRLPIGRANDWFSLERRPARRGLRPTAPRLWRAW